MNNYLVDSDIVIDFLNLGDMSILPADAEKLYLSVVSYAEILYGIKKSKSKRKFMDLSGFVKENGIKILPIDQVLANKFVSLKINLEQMLVSQNQLVDMAILIGTDFNKGIKGIGPKKSLDLIKKTGRIEKALGIIDNPEKPNSEEIEELRKIFLKPNVTDSYSLNWSETDKEKVLSILCDRHQFTRDRIEPVLEKFSSLKNNVKQKTLF